MITAAAEARLQANAAQIGMKMESKGCTQDCAGCGKTIAERYLLKALDMFWHEDCLKCVGVVTVDWARSDPPSTLEPTSYCIL
ncbi:rhombotin-2-like [Macrosteles quadrilineatus]|uniref:rhombotin-2-like n=1 Tax=Macrosteles quadrilineatus TaxID=74068 RepID=UPI0023E15487|nr:rhombotin-2-like [Macrosteles quadrilineatus]